MSTINPSNSAYVQSLSQSPTRVHVENTSTPSAPNGPSFSDRLEGAVDQVNEAQAKAKQSATDYETGKRDDLAAVMVDQQIASLGFQMTLQVRNKALSAYRDIINMPV